MTTGPGRTAPELGADGRAGLEIRRAVHDELGEVAALAARVLPDVGSAESLQASVARPAAELWVAVSGAAIVGFLVALRVDAELEVLWLGVDAGQRRRRVGARLLDAALAGCSRCHLEVRANHREAQAFYRQRGFFEAGRRRAYYPEGDDALLLCWSREGGPHG